MAVHANPLGDITKMVKVDFFMTGIVAQNYQPSTYTRFGHLKVKNPTGQRAAGCKSLSFAGQWVSIAL
jgi:hypothetical protein